MKLNVILKMGKIGSFFFLLSLAFSCNDGKEEIPFKYYSGPMAMVDCINTIYTDSGKVVLKMKAPMQHEFSNGDREFAKGMYVEFYTHKGELQSTLKANYVHYNKLQDLYTGTGDVKIINLMEEKSLTTELLHWSRTEKRIFTNKFVTIKNKGEILNGTGLSASQDFKTYRILKPSGVLNQKI